jgi:DICT domain-containing protein
VKGLAIKDVAERTGLAAGTIRMWEQRYGFPEPQRTPSGYRVYSPEDVELLRRVAAFRERGLSVPASLERARGGHVGSDRPSLYGALLSQGVPMSAHRLRKRTLLAISRAIEDETLARAAEPFVAAAFQHERNYRVVEHRYRRLAANGTAVVFADFEHLSTPDNAPAEVPISAEDAIGNEWAVVVDAPGYAACLLAWEQPRAEDDVARADADRRFEAAWTLDPEVVRHAAQISCSLVGRADPVLAARYEELLADRPLAFETPAPALTALTNRMLAYLDG